MKSIVCILLASLFLFQSAGKLLIIANYQINKDYISKNLCENKAKPILKCNGKCHLKKELQKEDKKENAPANNLKEKFEVQLFSENKATISYSIIKKERSNLNSYYLLSNYSKHLLAVFHPPQA